MAATSLIPENLHDLIAQGEGQRVEFKRSLAELETGARSVTAMANADGGIVLFGVRDDGTISGVEMGAQTKERVVQAVTANTDPTLYPSVEVGKLGEQILILVTVPESQDKPHLVQGRAYKRVGAADVQMSRGEYERLLLQRQQVEFDHQLVKGATHADLDEARLEWYIRQRAERRGIRTPTSSVRETLINLGALVEEKGELTPTAGGLLFFGRDPQRFFPHSEVRIARFKGTTMGHFIDSVDLRGTLPEMIDEAERFIRRNTRTAAKVVGFKRREISEYPHEATREAICNAVCHRDYFMDGSTVRIMIFDDRIEVNSPGSLPPGVTIKNIDRKHVLRNKLIANYLYDIYYIEKWGTGITKMRGLMHEHGLAEPIFEDLKSFFSVTFYGPGEKILNLIPEEGVVDLRELGLNERQIEALRLMVNEGVELSNRAYRDMFAVSRPTATRDLRKLVETGWVRETGKGRSQEYAAQ
ncbi:MAG: helix-turn-helix domain-containing protein [Anaerolineae bacterium]